MIYLDTSMSAPTVTDTAAILTRHSQKGVPIDYDKTLYYRSKALAESMKYRKLLQREINTPAIEISANSVVYYFQKKGKENIFKSTAKGNTAMDYDTIELMKKNPSLNEEEIAILELYQHIAKNDYIASSLTTFIYDFPIEKNVLSFDKNRIILVRPTWAMQNTGRLGMQGPALQNIASEVKDIQTCKEGFVMYEVDSGQIEPKIIYSYYVYDELIKMLIEKYGDAYFGLLHYCRMLLSDIVKGNMNQEIKPITDELVALRKSLKTIGNAANYGVSKDDGTDPLRTAYLSRIGNHKERLAWVDRVTRQVLSGNYIFETAFGTKIDVSAGDGGKKYGWMTDGHIQHMIRCGVNNPVQGTAGDMMRFSVVEANKILRQKSPESQILKYTHDSGTFHIKEDDFDKVEPDLSGVTSYQVTHKGVNWIPITSDPIIKRGSGKDAISSLL